MVALSSGVDASIIGRISAVPMNPWADYLVEYDQSPVQPVIVDLGTARNGIRHIADQMEKYGIL